MPTVLIGGGSGLIGTRLSQLLSEKGYTVWHLSRTVSPDAQFPTYHWDARSGQIDQSAVEGADYIINLAGAGIADKRWSEERKRVIIDSRVNTTRLLRDAIRRADRPVSAFLSASGANIYGNRGDELLREDDPPGSGFFTESCLQWEAAVKEVADLGIRTVILRTGVVLSTQGGALPKMTLPMSFFTGVYFGDGRQWMSWIHIDDICRMYIHAIEQEEVSGVFNGVGPQPVRNKAFIQEVAAAKDQSVLFVPAPEWALKIALGEMSHAVLDSVRLSSEKIEATGFNFAFPGLSAALQDVFQRKI